MLKIRLQRVGKKNQPMFRIVLAEKQKAVKKEVVEILGHYNPRTKDFAVRDPERVKYWISQHVQVSPTVHNLFIDKGLLSGEKLKAWKPKKKAEVVQAADVPAQAGNQTPAAEAPAPAPAPLGEKKEEVAEQPKEEPAQT